MKRRNFIKSIPALATLVSVAPLMDEKENILLRCRLYAEGEVPESDKFRAKTLVDGHYGDLELDFYIPGQHFRLRDIITSAHSEFGVTKFRNWEIIKLY